MSAHRQITALLLLQRRGTVTAAEVAEELEVSERTARRVLEALAVSGIPVYSRPGRNGGWSLLGGARTDLSGLTAAEAEALFLVAGPGAHASPELRGALRKLVAALPATFRTEAEAAAESTIIDPTSWGSTRHRRETPHLGAVRRAVVERRRLRLGYTSRDAAESLREVSPLGVVDKRGVWYLVADTDRGRRTFRVDRISSVDLLDERFERPKEFDLDEAWQELTSAYEAQWPECTVTAVVEPAWMGLVASVVDGVLERTLLDDGRLRVRLECRTEEAAAGQLAGFADVVEVLEPPGVIALLASTGQRLLERYGELLE
ncbi:MAG: WYL domain-containing protein [Acidimicrobiales bacterium]|nr:WYL domain-containing protein [Acidimicrobiales bacterium]